VKATGAAVALGDVATFTSGGTPDKTKPEYYGGETPWISSADIVDGAIVAARTYVTRLGIARSAASVAGAGTVLLVTRTGVGKVAVAPYPLSFSQDITAVVPDTEVLDAAYLERFLTFQQHWLVDRARGATIKGVTRDVVTSMRIPLPPLDDQRRIAGVLDAAHRVRAKRRLSGDAIDQLRDAVFASTVVSSSGSWPLVRVADLVDESKGGIRTGPFGSQLLHSEFVESGIAVLGIDNAVANEFRWGARRYISETKYDELGRYTVHPGDVLITIMGTCGRVAVVPDDIAVAINTKHLCCISLDRSKCLPHFLHAYFLRHPIARHYLASRAKGAIMAGMNMGIIKELLVSLPPIEIQQDLADRLAGIDGVHRWALAHEGQLDALFASLQHRAFTGAL
jgi:type I restriction enzyme S subunit